MAAKKLLVADDSLTIQKVIRLALSGAAAGSSDTYDIQAVSDGNDAIQQISLFRPDIVLIDVSLPGKSSFEVKRAINEHRDLDEIRFVLMSSAFEKVDEKQVQEVEFHGRLTKPFDPAHLREVLSQVLAQVHDKHREPTLFIQRTPDLSNAPEMPPLPPMASAMPPIPPLPPAASAMPAMPPLPPISPETGDSHSWAPDFDEPISYPNEIPPPPIELNEPQTDGIEIPAIPSFMPETSRSDDRDADIRNLTESTIRMAGLDDFEWSVQEPSLKPPAGFTDTADSDFSLPASEGFSPPPPPIEVSAAVSNDLEFEPPAAVKQPIPEVKVSEESIRIEVERVLQGMVKKLLPDIAERLVKEEIRKLLNEQPGS